MQDGKRINVDILQTLLSTRPHPDGGGVGGGVSHAGRQPAGQGAVRVRRRLLAQGHLLLHTHSEEEEEEEEEEPGGGIEPATFPFASQPSRRHQILNP